MRVIAVALLLVWTCAYSQGPPPSSGKQGQPPEAEATKRKGEAERDQRGTERAPLVIKGLPPAEKTKAESDREAKEREEKAANERSMVTYSGTVALFTVLLFLIAGIQAAMFAVQLSFMKRSLRESETAASAAKSSADAAVKTADLARDQFITDQRPWVTLDAAPKTALAYDSAGWAAGVRWHITVACRAHNIGKTPATRVAVHGNILPFCISAMKMADGKPVGPIIPGTEVKGELEAICAFQEHMHEVNMGFGEVVFPGENRGVNFTLNGNPDKFDPSKLGSYSGQFIVFLCVTYGSTLSDAQYRTAKAFHLWSSKSPDKGIPLTGATIEPAYLGFQLHPMDGCLAT